MDWEKIIAAVITAVILPLAAGALRCLSAKYSETRWCAFLREVFTAVQSAEQLYETGAVEDRLRYATELLQAWLDKNRLRLSAERLRAYIEADVSRLPHTPAEYGDEQD